MAAEEELNITPGLHFGAGMTGAAEETARQARWMEELGYEYFSAGEHFMRGNPPRAPHAATPPLFFFFDSA